jgi:ATP-dependent Clp protease ATP-binding subunit ClpB
MTKVASSLKLCGRKPYSVVLLDEIEKANPDVWNVLLQVLDDGRLTDNKGRVVNFKNTIIIMTSNIGSSLIQDAFQDVNENNLEDVVDRTRMDVMSLLRQTIRPEFLNRVDEIIMFQPLLKKEIRNIVSIQLNALKKTLEGSHIELTFTDYLLDYLADNGYDPQFGARPLKRLIQKQIVNQLSKKILAGEIDRSNPVLIDVFGNTVVFRNEVAEKVK